MGTRIAILRQCGYTVPNIPEINVVISTARDTGADGQEDYIHGSTVADAQGNRRLAG